MRRIYFIIVALLALLSLSACSSLPGKSRVEGALAFKTKQALKPVALSLDKRHQCSSYTVTNTTITSTHRLKYKIDPSWTETWTVDVCGAKWNIPIRFTHLANGQTGIFISKAGIKRYTGGSIQNTEAPMTELLQRAEQQDTTAQLTLGERYADMDKGNDAYKWFTAAANDNNAEAQYRLGEMYYNGNGVAKNYQTAISWYEKAAHQNHHAAAYRLGYLYEKGIGVRQNAQTAFNYYKKAASQGNAQAQYALAQFYSQGTIAPRDEKEAFHWASKAAHQGLAEAEYSVGHAYASGTTVTKNYREAEKWYLRAAEQRYAEAQFSLGSLYTAGITGAPDYTKAYQWIYIASRQGRDPKYKQMLDILAKEMKPAQIQTAKQLANAWLQRS